ncbi:transcriptional regulator [Sphaerisporangium krabiense]|uniref:DNA-binding MurR/RpiR family transcriptional regulator n=1 Tax=Sphaerisporangium krabiense TaxID=763782 RepID=A0A7W9DTL1_9ACTN|nr:MurR/RpiR family transcriptional regulator [Sphaerisporangium krabiense]MBB5630713.1 DNA-binding MurR/RpiR family transcriptional regulator [Sphaerisporangium krabiense]GII67420.1 transcriptional regulator [Sphaerisporangium krabiense]
MVRGVTSTAAGGGERADAPARLPEGSEDASRVAARLRELIEGHRLSPAQRRIARHLLGRPHEAVFLSSVDIAVATGTSQPSVTRFAFALGFSGFPEFRDDLRAAMHDGPVAAATELGPVQAMVDSEIRNLELLRDSLGDTRRLHELAGALAASRPLPVVGLRVSAPLAHLFGYLAAKAHPDVRVFDAPGSALEDGLSRARDAGARWVLAFGLPRYPRELRDGLVWARKAGLRVGLVTDNAAGALAEHADAVLTAPVSSRFAFDSQAAPSVLCAVLVHAMVDALPVREQAAIEHFESSAGERRLFLPD